MDGKAKQETREHCLTLFTYISHEKVCKFMYPQIKQLATEDLEKKKDYVASQIKLTTGKHSIGKLGEIISNPKWNLLMGIILSLSGF